MIGPAADIDGITDCRNPILQSVTGQTAENSANQYHERHTVLREANLLRQSLHRKRRIGIDLLIALLVGPACGSYQVTWGIELCHEPVNGNTLHSGLTSAWGSRVRISKIEIIGRMRTNKNMAARNIPMVPKYVIQSQRVG